jgi:hypothetical protein
MTVQTILFNRGMLPHEGTSFFCVAFVAEFVDRIGFYHLCAKTTVRIMAVMASCLSFFNRMT